MHVRYSYEDEKNPPAVEISLETGTQNFVDPSTCGEQTWIKYTFEFRESSEKIYRSGNKHKNIFLRRDIE